MSEEKIESAKPTVLVVDDSADSLQLLNGLLKDEYRVRLQRSF